MKRSFCRLLLGATTFQATQTLVDSLSLQLVRNPNHRLRTGASVRNVANLGASSSSSSSSLNLSTNNDDSKEILERKLGDGSPYSSFPQQSEQRLRGMQYSARQARILAPLGLVFGSLASPFSTQAEETETLTSSTFKTGSMSSFEPTVEHFFPQSLPTSTVRRLVRQALLRRHYNPSNTLLATSICPDEINGKPHLSLSTALHEDLLGEDDGALGIFALGGLAGLPFAGISGLQALFSHVPRNVVILLGPHIGVSQNGNVGLIERGGPTKKSKAAANMPAGHLSTACGAAIGAGRKLFKQCHDHDHHHGIGHPCLPAPPTRLSFLDYEEDYILNQLRPSIEAMPEDLSEDERNARITAAIYTMSLTMFMNELEVCWQQGGCPDHVEEITLLSGIIVNQGEAVAGNKHQHRHHHHHPEDYFQPRLFQSWTRPEGTQGWSSATTVPPPLVDLFASTFGNGL